MLNAPAADRRAEPERSVARATALALLASAPQNAVLVTGGDNDSFPAWYAQAVEGVRPDVTVVVAPLLGTEWYRAQLARRASLVTQGEIAHTRPASMMIAAIAREARARGRPVAASIMTPAATRDAVGDLTVARGVVYVERAWALHCCAGIRCRLPSLTWARMHPTSTPAFAAAFVRAHPLPSSPSADDGHRSSARKASSPTSNVPRNISMLLGAESRCLLLIQYVSFGKFIAYVISRPRRAAGGGG